MALIWLGGELASGKLAGRAGSIHQSDGDGRSHWLGKLQIWFKL